MERLTGKTAKSLMEAYSKVYVQKEQVEILSEEVEQLDEQGRLSGQQRAARQAEIRAAQEKLRAAQEKLRSEKESGENVVRRGQGGRGGDTTRVTRGSAPDEKENKKPETPTVLPDKKPPAPVQSSASNLKPGSPNVVVNPKSGEETKFARRLPTMAELKAAQAARLAAKEKGLSAKETEYRAVKAGISAGNPKPVGTPVQGGVKPVAGAPTASAANTKFGVSAKPLGMPSTLSTPSTSGSIQQKIQQSLLNKKPQP